MKIQPVLQASSPEGLTPAFGADSSLGMKVLDVLMNPSSQIGIGFRDSFDNIARVKVADSRSKIGGRERMLDEWLTTVLFTFGVPVSKRIYDRVLGATKLLPLPEFDPLLLYDDIQKLTPEAINKFATAEDARHLRDLVNNDTIKAQLFNKLTLTKGVAQSLYATNGLIKVLVSSIPVALFIGFGIPYLNHRRTVHALAEQIRNRDFDGPDLGAHKDLLEKLGIDVTGEKSLPVLQAPLPQVRQLQAPVSYENPQEALAYSMTGGAPFTPAAVTQPTAFNTPVTQTAFATPSASSYKLPASAAINPFVTSPETLASSHKPSATFHYNPEPPQFGSAGKLAAQLLQNDRLTNMLFVDFILSGGRVATTRNPNERLEMLVKEGAIIAFLYGISEALNKGIKSFFVNQMSVVPDLSNQMLNRIGKEFGKAPEAFVDTVDAAWRKLGFNETEQRVLLAADLAQPSPDETALLKRFTEKIRTYAHEGAKGGNYLLDQAIELGYVSVHRAKSEAGLVERVLNKAKQPAITGFNLKQRIQIGDLLDMANVFETMKKHAGRAPESFGSFVRRSFLGKQAAYWGSNAVCFVGLAIMVPLLQHWLSYKRTGKYYFTGVDENQVRQAVELVKHDKQPGGFTIGSAHSPAITKLRPEIEQLQPVA